MYRAKYLLTTITVLGIIPEAQDSNRDSTCLSQESRSLVQEQGPKQTELPWSAVVHGRSARRRQRVLAKKILEKRGKRE
jgi:hypothetical protein